MFYRGICLLILVLLPFTAIAEDNMQKVATKTLLEYGLLGVIVLAMGWYIIFLSKKHEKTTSDLGERYEKAATILGERIDSERDQWRIQSNAQFLTVANLTEKSTEAMVELKTTIDRIKE